MTVFPLLLSVFVLQDPLRPAAGVDPQSIFDRAIDDFMRGRVRESADGFDMLAELMPENVPRLWQRGIAQYYLGRYKECAAQFAAHKAVNPTDVENVAWHFVCVARAESPQKARASVLTIVPQTRVPMPELYDLLRGLTTPERLLAAAMATGKPEAEFDANYYLGLYYEALGNAERARIHITVAAEERFARVAGFMHAAARVHLRRLQKGLARHSLGGKLRDLPGGRHNRHCQPCIPGSNTASASGTSTRTFSPPPRLRRSRRSRRSTVTASRSWPRASNDDALAPAIAGASSFSIPTR